MASLRGRSVGADRFASDLSAVGQRLHDLATGEAPERLHHASILVASALRAGQAVLLFGNGGSAADAQHLAAELVGRFGRAGAGYRGIALTTDSSVVTALANDFGYDGVFARQVETLGRPGDVAIGISTSGRSLNVLRGIEAARAAGLRTIAFTGPGESPLAQCVDVPIQAPGATTTEIQTCHIAIGQLLLERAIEIAERPAEGAA